MTELVLAHKMPPIQQPAIFYPMPYLS